MPADCKGNAELGKNYCVKLPKYKSIGEDPEGVLGTCEGDCDTDEQCGQGLKCFQRFVWSHNESAGPNSCAGKVSVCMKIYPKLAFSYLFSQTFA